MAHIHGAAKAAVDKHLVQTGLDKAMEHGVGQASTSFHNLAKGAAASGALATASTHTGRSFVSKVLKHPLVLFGLGAATGYLIHKYRKEIIAGAQRAGELGKDFVLQQRENLEDIVAESREVKEE